MTKIFTLSLLLIAFAMQAQSVKTLPGKIEAEDYTAMNSIGTENTSDTGGGRNVGWINDGSWMDYSVSAPSAGYYTFNFRIANSYSPEATIALRTASGTSLGKITVPQTGGWQSWQTISFVALLPQGTQTIRVFAEKGGWNFNWFDVTASRSVASGKVEAESFDAMHEVRIEATGDEGGGQNVGYIDDNDWMDYNISLPNAREYEIQFRVANSYGSGIIEIRNASGAILGQVAVPKTGGWQNWTTISATASLPAGSQVLRIFAKSGAFNLNWFSFVSASQRTTGIMLPAKVQAESYDDSYSVQLENTTDTDGGQNVGWIQDNSWMDYDVNVPAAGIYTFGYRIANGYSPEATLALRNSNGTEYGRIQIPQTGGTQGWRTANMLVSLPAGSQRLRIFAPKGGWNFNWFEVKESRTLTTRIEAETFDVASDVRTEQTGDAGGDLNVGYIDDNDWMDYNVNVPAAGTYTINFRVANSWGNGNIQFKNTNGTVLGSVDVPQTGGWQNYTTVRTTVQLEAGSQIFRIFANRGAFNFNWFEVIPGSVQGQSVLTFDAISNKNITDGSFNLVASSTNPETPILFTSSNPSIVSVSNASGIWKASIHAAGQVTITASQAGNNNYLTAENILRTFTVSDNPSNNVSLGTKIPMDAKRWYQLTNAANGLEGLFDGKTQEEVNTGWGKIINNYEAYYPLREGEKITLSGIKFFDYTGNATDFPLVLSVITDQWERIPVATFTGEIYNGWVGPYPNRQLSGDAQFKLDQPMNNIRYLVMTMSNTLPTEIEFYGSYTPAPAVSKPARAKHIKLRDMLGVNGYEWYFQDGAHIETLVESKVQAAKSFTGLRHYMDWEKLEANEGVYSYNPTLSGSWNYDLIYERCKQENIEVLACLKTQPNWMRMTYPEDQRDPENVPVRYGKDFADPRSYIEQAKVAFQYTARYGSNTNVDPSLLSVSTTPRWTNDPVNTIKIGLNLIKYIECDNERDKWWKGRKGYQTAREYAANMSAFYDGHKNTMGPGVGVKNADPNMKVVIAGLVTGPDFVKGMVDWCREFRGYNADGTVNLCWDIVNFHLYTDNASSSQSGTSTRGAAPEVTNAKDIVAEFVKVARELSNDMPVWNTEAGYDVHQSSPLKAIPIGNKSALQTQADWALRTSLFSARNGVEKLFFYQMYDDNPGGGMFASSGFVNNDQSRRPSADYFLQTHKLFGEYEYKETLNNDPIVDRYELNGKSVYILTVPDEVGRTAEYTVNLNQSGVARIYTPTPGADNMAMTQLPIVDGKVTVTAGETPIFVMAADGQNARQAAMEMAPPVENREVTLHADVNVYPNPSSDFVSIDLANEKTEEIEIRVFDAKSGRLHKTLQVSKTGNRFSHQLNIAQLPASVYIVEVKQGNDRAFRKIAKVN